MPSSGLSGFGNLFTFQVHPACYVEKALVKICVTTFTLALGVSQMKLNPGQDLSSSLPMFISVASQTVGRLYAFKSLVLMATPLGNFKYVILLSSHAILVLLIKTLFELRSTFIYAEPTPTSIWKIIKFLTSWMSSIIVMIHPQTEAGERGYYLLSYALFHLLILIENTTLVWLPYLLEAKYYPPSDCLTPDSRLTAVLIVMLLWLVGAGMHAVHYKLIHPWDELNGTQLTLWWKWPLQFTFLTQLCWKAKVQRIRVKGFQLWCEDYRQVVYSTNLLYNMQTWALLICFWVR
jgi:hypothetical protein